MKQQRHQYEYDPDEEFQVPIYGMKLQEREVIDIQQYLDDLPLGATND